MGASLLRAVDLPQLITDEPGAFREQAIALGRDRDALIELRRHLESGRRSFTLFDTVTFARNLESAYEGMASRYDSGEAGPFAVPDNR